MIILLFMNIYCSWTISYAKNSNTLEGFLYENDKHFYKKKSGGTTENENLSEKSTYILPEDLYLLGIIGDLALGPVVKKFNENYKDDADATKSDALTIDLIDLGPINIDLLSVDAIYYYDWLYALKDIVDYMGTVHYYTEDLGKDTEILKKTIEACKLGRGELASFTKKDSQLPNPAGLRNFSGLIDFWNNKTDIFIKSNFDARSKKAYSVITKTGEVGPGVYKGYVDTNEDKVTDEFELKVCDTIMELQAAYDYHTKTRTYGDYILDDYETKKNYTYEQIRSYINSYGNRLGVSKENREELKKNWEEKIGMSLEEAKIEFIDLSTTKDEQEAAADAAADESKEDPDKSTIFKQPKRIEIASVGGVEDAINDADEFVGLESKPVVNKGILENFSQNMYGILLTIGIVIAVIIGTVLGIKLMIAPIGERVEAKKLLVPYVVGCIVVFGAFGTWKLIVTIMQEL